MVYSPDRAAHIEIDKSHAGCYNYYNMFILRQSAGLEKGDADMKYYDIGLNLFCRQFSDPEKIIADAEKEGVKCILTGSDTEENILVEGFVRSHQLWGTAGIHPHNADHAGENDYEIIEKCISGNKRIVAVGECGLDYNRMFSTRENQLECLKRHIEISQKYNKPMFLHEREAADDLTACFEKYPDICRRSVVHCFTGSKDTLERYLDMGFFIGITGWICDDRRAGELREAVTVLPLDRVLLETDAPYLTPRNIKGLDRVNVPQNIKYVAAELAKYMGVSEEELAAAARSNTERLFGI